MAISEFLIGALSAFAVWGQFTSFGYDAWRLLSTWVALVAAVYYLASALVTLIWHRRPIGREYCPMLQGGIIVTALFLLILRVICYSLDVFVPGTVSNIWLIEFLLPILMLLEWVLFSKKGVWRYFEPFYWLAFSLIYFTAILVSAEFMPRTAPLIYSYEFVNYPVVGIDQMLWWLAIFAAIILIVGYVLWLLDFALSGQLARHVVMPRIKTVIVEEEVIDEPVSAHLSTAARSSSTATHPSAATARSSSTAARSSATTRPAAKTATSPTTKTAPKPTKSRPRSGSKFEIPVTPTAASVASAAAASSRPARAKSGDHSKAETRPKSSPSRTSDSSSSPTASAVKTSANHTSSSKTSKKSNSAQPHSDNTQSNSTKSKSASTQPNFAKSHHSSTDEPPVKLVTTGARNLHVQEKSSPAAPNASSNSTKSASSPNSDRSSINSQTAKPPLSVTPRIIEKIDFHTSNSSAQAQSSEKSSTSEKPSTAEKFSSSTKPETLKKSPSSTLNQETNQEIVIKDGQKSVITKPSANTKPSTDAKSPSRADRELDQ